MSAPVACPGRACPPLGSASSEPREGKSWPAPTTFSEVIGHSLEQTAEAVQDGWFKTGDGGEIDELGYLTITDRKKDVIISGGENVSSIEVEDCLYQHPAVAEVAVIGVPDPKWGESVKALVVLSDGAAASEQELIEFVRARMAHFKCPSSIEFHASLARTATGKLQKFKLRAPFWEGRDRQVSGG